MDKRLIAGIAVGAFVLVGSVGLALSNRGEKEVGTKVEMVDWYKYSEPIIEVSDILIHYKTRDKHSYLAKQRTTDANIGSVVDDTIEFDVVTNSPVKDYGSYNEWMEGLPIDIVPLNRASLVDFSEGASVIYEIPISYESFKSGEDVNYIKLYNLDKETADQYLRGKISLGCELLEFIQFGTDQTMEWSAILATPELDDIIRLAFSQTQGEGGATGLLAETSSDRAVSLLDRWGILDKMGYQTGSSLSDNITERETSTDGSREKETSTED